MLFYARIQDSDYNRHFIANVIIIYYSGFFFYISCHFIICGFLGAIYKSKSLHLDCHDSHKIQTYGLER